MSLLKLELGGTMSKSVEILKIYLPVSDDWCGNYCVSNMHNAVDAVVCLTLTEFENTFIVRVSGTDDFSRVARFDNKEQALECIFNLVKVHPFNSDVALSCGLLLD